jgi:hypothetical protein
LSPCPCFVAVTCMRFRELIVLSSLLWTWIFPFSFI